MDFEEIRLREEQENEDPFAKNVKSGSRVSSKWSIRITTCFFLLRMFLVGMEYTLIMSSIWIYLKQFDSRIWIFGILLCVCNILGFISNLIVGQILQYVVRPYVFICLLSCLQLCGNFVYSVNKSIWYVICGRILTSLATGSKAATDRALGFSYQGGEVRRILIYLEMSRMLGMMVGASLPFAFTDLVITSGFNYWDKFNISGLFLGLSWSIIAALSLPIVLLNFGNRDVQLFLKTRLTTVEELKHLLNKADKNCDQTEEDRSAMKKKFYIEMITFVLSRSVILLFYTGFEILVPLLASEDMHFNIAYTGLIYAIGTILMICTILVLLCLGSILDHTLSCIVSHGLSAFLSFIIVFYQKERTHLGRAYGLYFAVLSIAFMTFPLLMRSSASVAVHLANSDKIYFIKLVDNICSVLMIGLGPVLVSLSFSDLAVAGVIAAILSGFSLALLLYVDSETLLSLNRVLNPNI